METKIRILNFALLITFQLLIKSTNSITIAASGPSTTMATATATVAATSSSNYSKTYKNYLKAACNSTTYPKLCYNSLSSYSTIIKTNDQILCSTALNLSLQISKNSSALIKALSYQKGLGKTEAEVIKDCIDEMGDSIDELKQSLSELGNLKFNSSYLNFQISNVKTWVSAAITDENTCTEAFDDVKVSPKIKRKINKSISNVVRMTSNALALINCKFNFY